MMANVSSDIEKRAERRKQRLSFGPLKIGFETETAGKAPDVFFKLGHKKFPAHKDVLCEISEVFTKMFRGSLPAPKVIELHDFSPSSFELFLSLIYKGTKSVAVAMNPKESLDCLMIANKYMCTKLELFLRTKLVRHITYADVLQVLPYSELAVRDGWSIRSKCWSIIERDTAKVIRTEHFMNISWTLLCEILENSRLCVDEFELFVAVRKWAEKQKKRMDKTTTLIEAIGVAIYKIRFPVMTPGKLDFAKRSGLLNPLEVKDLEEKNSKNIPFPNKPRRNICMCRRLGNNCKLCMSDVATSVKGATGVKTSYQRTAKLIRSSLPSSKSSNSRRTRDVHAVIMGHSPKSPIASTSKQAPALKPILDLPTCECFKYKSCPAFPNGTTAHIMRKIGLQFL